MWVLMRITNHQHFVFQVAEEGANDSNQEQLKGKVVKFGWLEGVFVSGCLTPTLVINRFHEIFFRNFLDEMFAKHLGSDAVSEVDLGRWSRRSHSRIIMYFIMQCRNYNYGNFHVGCINQRTNQGRR